jgi:hypothetical protein
MLAAAAMPAAAQQKPLGELIAAKIQKRHQELVDLTCRRVRDPKLAVPLKRQCEEVLKFYKRHAVPELMELKMSDGRTVTTLAKADWFLSERYFAFRECAQPLHHSGLIEKETKGDCEAGWLRYAQAEDVSEWLSRGENNYLEANFPEHPITKLCRFQLMGPTEQFEAANADGQLRSLGGPFWTLVGFTSLGTAMDAGCYSWLYSENGEVPSKTDQAATVASVVPGVKAVKGVGKVLKAEVSGGKVIAKTAGTAARSYKRAFNKKTIELLEKLGEKSKNVEELKKKMAEHWAKAEQMQEAARRASKAGSAKAAEGFLKEAGEAREIATDILALTTRNRIPAKP